MMICAEVADSITRNNLLQTSKTQTQMQAKTAKLSFEIPTLIQVFVFYPFLPLFYKCFRTQCNHSLSTQGGAVSFVFAAADAAAQCGSLGGKKTILTIPAVWGPLVYVMAFQKTLLNRAHGVSD